MICESPEMKRVMDIALKAAKSNAPILLVGETGVGKEIIGDFIHQNSNRKNNPIVKINCASIPKELVESELFGNVKGAFTGAIMSREGLFKHAEGGTLLFDEIGELSTTCQAKLLRVLQ
ncbi:MAG: sigma-54 factor interaction domain-containing protein, partial [Nanoarchaeota archaeon]